MSDTILLMAYFIEEGTTYYAYEDSNGNWIQIGDKSYVYPQNGNRLIRDPFLARDLNGKFRLLYTEGWWGKSFGHAGSTDLIRWSEQKNDNIMIDINMCTTVWAPEFVCDPIGKDHMVHWTSSINNSPMIWFSHTKNFFEYTAPRILFKPEFPVIDSTIVKDGKRYIMAFKDESSEVKAIRLAFADSLIGPYKNITRPITPPCTEGPILINRNGIWHLYYDCFQENKWGLMTSENLIFWEEKPIKVPNGARHGSITEITKKELRTLQISQKSILLP